MGIPMLINSVTYKRWVSVDFAYFGDSEQAVEEFAKILNCPGVFFQSTYDY